MSVDIIILLTLLAPTFILFPLFAVLQCWLCRKETSWLGYIIPTLHGLASIPVFLVLFGMFAYSGITESVSTFNEFVLVEEATNSLTSKGIALFMVATILYHSVTVLYVVIYRKEKKKIALRDDLLIVALERLGEM